MAKKSSVWLRKDDEHLDPDGDNNKNKEIHKEVDATGTEGACQNVHIDLTEQACNWVGDDIATKNDQTIGEAVTNDDMDSQQQTTVGKENDH